MMVVMDGSEGWWWVVAQISLTQNNTFSEFCQTSLIGRFPKTIYLRCGRSQFLKNARSSMFDRVLNTLL